METRLGFGSCVDSHVLPHSENLYQELLKEGFWYSAKLKQQQKVIFYKKKVNK